MTDLCKAMLLVENVDQREALTALFQAMYAELPAPKAKKHKQTGAC